MCGVGNHAGKLDERCGFRATDPVRDSGCLEADFEAELAKFGGNVLGGGASLWRATGARSNILGKVSQLAVGVIIIQRSRFNGGELLEK